MRYTLLTTLAAALAAPSCRTPGSAEAIPPQTDSARQDEAPPSPEPKTERPTRFVRPAGVDELQAIFDAKLGAPHAQVAPKANCKFETIDLDQHGYGAFKEVEVLRSEGGRLETTLTVKYADNKIADCPVHLRSYNGKLVGPTMRVKPGDTLIVRLDNRLPENTRHDDDINVPHNFNTTNFHTHGFHVSPAGNSDNVLLSVEPNSKFEFEIKIPRDHPPGTFWYHAHVHGSTALQVSSGMAGALIVEGGLDDVSEIAKAKELTLLFQQIVYDEQGVIESYEHFGPRRWADTKRHTTINGQLAPTISMRPGEIQRWRLIHGGVRETLVVSLQKHELVEVAVDGLALGTIDRWPGVELHPGYRSDVLVRAAPLPRGKTEAVYYLMDAPSPADRSLLGVEEPERILAKVVVSGKPKPMKFPQEAQLAPLRPHNDITDQELDGVEQTVEFDIALAACDPDQPRQPCVPCNEGEPGCETRFMVNKRPFNNDNIRPLLLGTASKWQVSSTNVTAHPFHIHVNPFQMTREGPDGEDETVWRDTVLIPAGKSIELRSRYQRYVGAFVLHCHILDHEDQGMMQVVEITNGASDHGH